MNTMPTIVNHFFGEIIVKPPSKLIMSYKFYNMKFFLPTMYLLQSVQRWDEFVEFVGKKLHNKPFKLNMLYRHEQRMFSKCKSYLFAIFELYLFDLYLFQLYLYELNLFNDIFFNHIFLIISFFIIYFLNISF